MKFTATIAGENITQKWARNGGFGSFGTGAAYAGYTFGSPGSNYVTCVRIRMPGAGISAQFKIAYSHDAGANSEKKMRWKITKAAADNVYENANAGVSGDGECSVLPGSGYFTVDYSGSFSAGEYLYLYLWTGAAEDVYTLSTVAAAGSHVCSYTEGTASSVSVSGQYLGSPVTIRITRNNSSFTHRLTYSFAGHTGTIAAGVGTVYTWTPELSVFGPYIPNAVSGECTVTCETYNGDVQVGSAVSAKVTLSVPAGCVPEVSAGWIASVTAQNAGTAADAFSSFVQGYSRVKVVFDSGKIAQSYGASLASLKVAFQGVSVTASGGVAVTGTAVSAGSIAVRCMCTDSRGRSVSEDVMITVLSYAKPTLSDVTVFRADSSGNADDEGAWICAKAKAVCSPLNGENQCSLLGFWKENGGEYGSAVQMVSGEAVLLAGTLSPAATYTAKIAASDSLGNRVSVEMLIPTASCAFHFREGGKGAAFFGYSEKDDELSLSGRKITNVGTPADAGDAVPLGYAQGAFAPHGHGLGLATGSLTVLSTPAEADACTKAGWYEYYSSTTLNGSGTQYGGIFVIPSMWSVTQFFFCRMYYGCCMKRIYQDGVWQPWEWINPPLASGVEYRTTERWQGKPVYVKLLSLGNLPNATEKAVYHNIANLDYPLSITAGAKSSDWSFALPLTESSLTKFTFNYQHIAIKCTGNWSGYTAYATLKYTKS